MKLFKQVYRAINEKKIHHREPLEVYFDLLNDLLWQHCLDYGQRSSSLDKEALKEIYRETSGDLQQRFQKQDIDIKEIQIENSEPVIEKFVSAFIFIFQRQMIKRIKQQNQWFEMIEELLEELEKHGIEEPDILEWTKLLGRIQKNIQQENISPTGQLAAAFILAKLNDCIKEIISDEVKKQETVNGNRISQIKHLLKKKQIANRKALQEILLMDV